MMMRAFTMMKNKRKWYIIIGALIIIALIIAIILLLRSCNGGIPPNTPTESKQSTTSNKELDFTPAEDKDTDRRIQIPAVTGLHMRAGQLQQTVDFFNPKDNNCYFVISLYLSDDTLIYKSDMIAPGEHINDITLLQELQRGIYRNCRMVYNCYSLDSKQQLNGSDVILEINSK